MLDEHAGVWLRLCFFREGLATRSAAFIASVRGLITGGMISRNAAIIKPSGRRLGSDQSEETLYRMQKMESLGRLTAGVAHDFNNLLTVVLGNATALRINAEARGDSEASRRAELIERVAERGGRLAGQLLAFSGKQMLRPESTSVYRIISATTELLGQAAGESVRIRVQAEQSLWNCRVDPGQLESAILNLVLNARDAMPTGGNITITCENQKVRSRTPGARPSGIGDYVRIDVKDTGCGIAPELMEKVFEPFFTTKPIGQGSGLGLAQVYGFAGQSGGWVELESVVAIGTTVSLYLPREKRRAGELPPDKYGPFPAGHATTILVVEPDTELRTTTSEILTRSGYRVLTAADGSAALAHLVSTERIHLLLVDAQLPGGVNGLYLARSAQQVKAEIRVLVTSSTLKDAVIRARNGSPNEDKRFELLMKPYRPSDLISVVGAVLSSDTFSTETEEMLADARKHAPLRATAVLTTATKGAAEVRRFDEVTVAGHHGNTIRLGVMPFRTIGANTDIAFSQGLAEEISRAFSRFRMITCVAPASVAALVDEPRGPTERWRPLDLDFLVDGSFRKKGNDIRVLLRLINMRGSGEISWGQRFDSLMPDVLNLQDQIASETAAQVVPELMIWEGQQAISRPQVDPSAYDLMLRAIPAVYCLDEAGFREAGVLLERSLALDPVNAGCHSWLAHWYLFALGQGWAADTTLAIERADHLSQQAVSLDPEDARGFSVAGHVKAFLHNDAEAALWLHDRAIALNPSFAMAWCYSGLAYCYLGQHAEAIRRIEHAQRLSPHDPQSFLFDTALMTPLLLLGQYDAAVAVGQRARSHNPAFSSAYKGLLVAFGHLGAYREAAKVWKALAGLEPQFSIATALTRSPLLRSEDRQRYAVGLRLAGVPERSRS